MKNSSIFAVSCMIYIVVCYSGCSCGDPTPIPDPPPIKYGCSAKILKGLRGKKGKQFQYTSSTKSSMAEAESKARDTYLENYPDTSPQINCWDCGDKKYVGLEREVCNMVIAGIYTAPGDINPE